MDHGLRLGLSMPDAPGDGHSMLRRRHLGLVWGTPLVRDLEHRRNSRGMRGADHPDARFERVAGQVRDHVVRPPP